MQINGLLLAVRGGEFRVAQLISNFGIVALNDAVEKSKFLFRLVMVIMRLKVRLQFTAAFESFVTGLTRIS